MSSSKLATPKVMYDETELAELKENNPLRYEIAMLNTEGWAKRWDQVTESIRERKRAIDVIEKYKEKRRR